MIADKRNLLERWPALRFRAAAFDRLGASAAVLDGDGIIVDTNQAWRLFAQLNGGSCETSGVGVNYLDVCDRAAGAGEDVGADVATGLRQILHGERKQMNAEYVCPSPTDDRWFMMQASALPESEGVGAVVFHVDITARKRLVERLRVATDQDALTGLPSRGAAGRHLEEHLAMAREVGGLVWTLFVEIDDFEAVNDAWGQDVRDELFVRVGLRIRRALRDDDFLGRFGGDQYVVICPGVEYSHALAVADRLRTVMSSPFQIGDTAVSGRISVGVARSDAASTAASMFLAAEEEMHVDRRRGGSTGGALVTRVPAPTRRIASPPSERSAIVQPDHGRPQPSDRSRADAALAYSNDVVLFFGADGTIEWVSPACAQLFGIRAEAFPGLNGFDLIHVDDRASSFDAFMSIPNLGDHVTTAFRVVDGLGRIRWVEETATNLLEDPAVGCIVGSLRDVTERFDLLERIELDRRRLADAHAAARLGSFECDARTGHISRSDELCRILGAPTGSSTNTSRLDSVHVDDRRKVSDAFATAAENSDHFEIGFRIVRPSGEVRWVHVQGVQLSEPNSGVIAGTMLDITDRRAANDALAFQATHDWLTELPNPASLHTSLHESLADVGPNVRVMVAVVGIDNFGQVNDACGTSTGDEILRVLASRLRSEIEPGDLVGRIRGDEFVVARSATGDVNAFEFGRALRDLLGEPLQLGGEHPPAPRLSFGVGVTISSAGDSPESMLADADAAMREAKRDGDDRVVVFDDEARARATRRRRIAIALPLALERDELRLEYQPVLDLVSLRTVGFEALLRWTHPDLGPIAPVEFIPIAEASRLIVPIGTWVLEQALRQLAEWHHVHGTSGELWMAVNVSAQQLTPDFPERVQATISRTGVPAASVHLEITESVLMDRIDLALPTLAELRSNGVNISIDDFGTGYSSLSYLSRLPVDVLKIDRSFVQGLTADGDGASIIGAMVSLANGLGLDIVAEGVETVEQLDSLRALGCTNGQGFLWSRALCPDGALGWIVDSTLPVPTYC